MTSFGAGTLGSYDYGLVIHSVLISIIAASDELPLGEWLAAAHRKAKLAWLMGGAAARELGIWSVPAATCVSSACRYRCNATGLKYRFLFFLPVSVLP
jgi:hypothetical protein